MWIMTDVGFISIVKYSPRKVVKGGLTKPAAKHIDPNKDYLLVRSRIKEDITALFPDAVVETMPGADYLYRAVIERGLVAAVMFEKTMTLDYDSHAKDVAIRRSAPAQGRSAAYYGTWTAMAQMQPYRPYSRVPRDQERWVSTGKGKGKGNYVSWSNPARSQDPLPLPETAASTGDDDWFPWPEVEPANLDDPDLWNLSESERAAKLDAERDMDADYDTAVVRTEQEKPRRRRGKRGGRKHNKAKAAS